MLFDTHVHVNAEQFNEDLEDVIERAKEAGVDNMVVVGFDRPTIIRAMELIETYDFMYAAVGWHPVDAIDMTEDDLQWIEELSNHPKVVAIGEMGLDYHWDKSPKDVQMEVFRKQIRLAKKVGLPIIIHNREATADIVNILKEEEASRVGGIMHCFSGSAETALECINMNFYISLGGPVTFKNAKKPKEVAAAVPLDRLLIETDCPYLAPHPYRGKRNEPSYVKLVAEQIAEIKQLTIEEVSQATTENAKKLFGIN
ncbi:TatD family hydrolase [Peribacillus frigoritolerans]|jgi:TatD DNase family protein|uniref:TatD family hydrolase n=1 Tax=Peribacillus frigoritolerans TaxID=450367 RepID=A0AAJ1QIB1_9BACI|nr:MULTISPECIES: TatD family hydrolase [Peribacillus]MBD8138573.1 TatD family hydrolase [Bacillus sp. CFBP 13597]MCD1163475.1 TatD family hydrolase [Peribacillus castrilensis]PEF38789.1 TatD family deoxyribonuclease [Bacillus sp. AFS094228]PEO46346.1 TatD family deoxyribonuclease [Bacillus sp. AFS026049]PRS29187.1 TatD family deoxyribonuclease [Bacillus sp. RJGP41]TDL84826.1 TatD family deoxyribonuclease [Vibrio vulnificus]